MLVMLTLLSGTLRRLLASNLLRLHWNEHLILDRLGLVNNLWYQMNDIAALIGGLTHERLSSCHDKVWLLLSLFNNLDVGVVQLVPVAFAWAERSGRCRGGQALHRWTRWRFLRGPGRDWLLDGH